MADVTVQEAVLGVIPYVSRRKGLLGSELFNLIVTTRRLVFAAVTNEMLKEQARLANEEAKQQGKGLLGRTAAVMTSRKALWQRYLAMPIDTILTEQPTNFGLAHEQIKSIRIKQGRADEDGIEPNELIIETQPGGQKQTLKSNDFDVRDAKKLLGQVLGSVIK